MNKCIFSTKSIEKYCKPIREDIITLGKIISCIDKLKKSDEKLIRRDLNNGLSIEKIVNRHGSVLPSAKKMENYFSKLSDKNIASLEGVKNTAQKLSDIKEIYGAVNIKGTGLSELRKICNNNNFFKDVKFKCSEKAQEISQKVTEFFELVRETNKRIKNFSHSSAKNPIKDEILIVNKYYASIKKEGDEVFYNIIDIKDVCRDLKDIVLEKVGKLSQKSTDIEEVSSRTSPGTTKQDEKNLEEQKQFFSKNFQEAEETINKIKMDYSIFNYLKEFRTLEKEILADENNGVGISLPDIKKRMLTLDKRWKLFNKAVKNGNYNNNGETGALGIIEKNLTKIGQINKSLKSNNENKINIGEIENKVDNYMKQETKETLGVKEFVSSTTIDNFREKIKSLGQFGNAQESIKKLKQEIEALGAEHGSTYGALFGLFVIRNIYIEMLECLVKTNEFLKNSFEEMESCVKKLEGKKKKGKIESMLHSKDANMFTKLSSMGCFTGVMISIGCPYLAPVVATLAIVAIGVQMAQAASSTSGA